MGEGRLEPFLVIMVNGQNAVRLNGLDTELKDGDEVLIMPPITGGAWFFQPLVKHILKASSEKFNN